jgi:trehalose 6-phosphate phosphatase
MPFAAAPATLALHDRRSHRRPEPPGLASANALFLDIDGTLLEFTANPSGPQVDADLANMLPSLARKLGGAIALITGRGIADVDRLFPGLRLPVAGQHGCERRSADGTLHTHAPSSPGLMRMRDALTGFAARHHGLIVEDKGHTLALHYRQAPRLAAQVHRAVRAQIADTSMGGGWRLQPGKGILEVKPEGRDKGTAILEYMREAPFRGRTPAFIGDDATDELGFAAVAQLGGIAVKVGKGRTTARYRLRDVAAVRRWLRTAL